MNGITAIAVFALLGVAAGTAAVPAAFADHPTTEVTNAEGSSLPGCERTNECFVPHVVTIDAGGEIKWTNSDRSSHTVTSGVLGPRGERTGSSTAACSCQGRSSRTCSRRRANTRTSARFTPGCRDWS